MSAQNIDCGYSLEPPRREPPLSDATFYDRVNTIYQDKKCLFRRGGSNEYPQSVFLSRNKKNNVYPCKPQFYY